MGERFRSDQQLNKLAAGIAAYREANNDEWPDRLTDIQDCIDGNFETLTENPYTKDNPGYEYVKPAENADRSTSIILYQLRDGKRDLSLNVGFGDCRVSANTTAAKQQVGRQQVVAARPGFAHVTFAVFAQFLTLPYNECVF